MPVGYSDHTNGITVPIAAVAMGARIIEKHFTKSKKMYGSDAKHSMEPDEFKFFIGESMRLDPIRMDKETTIEELLEFYMGKNTPDRQNFIIGRI